MERFIYGTDYATLKVTNYDVSDGALSEDCLTYGGKKIACLYIVEDKIQAKDEVIGSIITCIAEGSDEAEDIDYHVLGEKETKETLDAMRQMQTEVYDNTEELCLSIHHVNDEKELTLIKKLFDEHSGDMYVQYREDGFKQLVDIDYTSEDCGYSEGTKAWFYNLFESWHAVESEG